ncbi:unnamed protein product [Cuscuta epithymum]|uniref:Uncharacterized protein n=1 Tax=Cuscuta epithymum TaxID=186058 RepID=A0AAV0DUZ6_9ASTE|nr:unnamed protein product [Cuscuta epithymum]
MEDAVSLQSNHEDIIAGVQSQFITKPMKTDGENYHSGGFYGHVSYSTLFDDPALNVRLPGTRNYPLQDLMEEKNTRLYERIVSLSKMSLDFYEKNHPGERYEFDSLKDVKSKPILGITYFIIFLAKNLGVDGCPSGTFKARVNCLMSSIKVQECELID